MFEFHGWITVRETYENRDADDNTIKYIVEKIKKHITELNWPSAVLDIKPINVEYYIWMVGCRNHKPTCQYCPVEFFKYVAKNAPGSYGILYVLDDEDLISDNSNKFTVYVLTKGILHKHDDPFLSPFIPTVESYPMD